MQAPLKQQMGVQDVQVSGELPESAFRAGSLKGRRISGVSAEEGALFNKRMRSDVPVRYANAKKDYDLTANILWACRCFKQVVKTIIDTHLMCLMCLCAICKASRYMCPHFIEEPCRSLSRSYFLGGPTRFFCNSVVPTCCMPRSRNAVDVAQPVQEWV